MPEKINCRFVKPTVAWAGTHANVVCRICTASQKTIFWATYKLVQEGRMTSYLKKNIVGQGTSWSHEAGSSRTSNKIIGQGRSWSQEAGPEHAKTTKIWGRVRAGPRRQDQLVPQKNCSAGYELVPSGRMSSYLKNMYCAGHKENLSGRVRAGPRRQD